MDTLLPYSGLERQPLGGSCDFSKTRFGTPQPFCVICPLHPRFLGVPAKPECDLSIVSSPAFSPELQRLVWDRWVNHGSSQRQLNSKFMEQGPQLRRGLGSLLTSCSFAGPNTPTSLFPGNSTILHLGQVVPSGSQLTQNPHFSEARGSGQQVAL